MRLQNIVLRKLNGRDSTQLECLIAEVEKALQDKTFWLPISDTEREHFFDTDWTQFCGAFCKGKLIGAFGLFHNKESITALKELAGVESDKVVKLGRAMVLPEYQGKGVMTSLSKVVYSYAKQQGFDCVVSTVHPQNEPSQRFLGALGLKKKSFALMHGSYERDILVKHI